MDRQCANLLPSESKFLYLDFSFSPPRVPCFFLNAHSVLADFLSFSSPPSQLLLSLVSVYTNFCMPKDTCSREGGSTKAGPFLWILVCCLGLIGIFFVVWFIIGQVWTFGIGESQCDWVIYTTSFWCACVFFSPCMLLQFWIDQTSPFACLGTSFVYISSSASVFSAWSSSDASLAADAKKQKKTALSGVTLWDLFHISSLFLFAPSALIYCGAHTRASRFHSLFVVIPSERPSHNHNNLLFRFVCKIPCMLL